ncbi:premRNA cleavage complex II protein Clp1 [Perkinsela sp. CCAP 1560/4]|nr:premRNA cleavage complex II protein Clp1 [Perkinsela sp. CCAP 1560/4]|eukprot:KNH05307.1 premRNA cleavage complex II protein Clp1 [Perkinsela sp. CCAP 1560/4]
MQTRQLAHEYQIVVPAAHELRVHIPFSSTYFGKAEKYAHVAVTITLEGPTGDGEICGCPVIMNNPIHISYGDSVSVYSRNGAHFRIGVTNEKLKNCIYISANSTYRSVVELHGTLNSLRWASTVRKLPTIAGRPPNLLILGPEFSGKNTVTTSLLNYACRDGWFPTLVDLDVCNPISGITGSTSLSAWDNCCPYDETSSVSGAHQTLAFPYGYPSPRDNPAAFMQAVKDSAAVLADRLHSIVETKSHSAGILINTPRGLLFEEMISIVNDFHVSDILVIQEDNLRVLLEAFYRNEQSDDGTQRVRVRGAHISGGVIPWKLRNREVATITHFLYGKGKVDLAPVLHRFPVESVGISHPLRWREDTKNGEWPSLASLRTEDTASLQNSLCMILRRSPDGANTRTTIFAVGVIKEIGIEGIKIVIPNLAPIPEKILFQSSEGKMEEHDKQSHKYMRREVASPKGTYVFQSYKNALFQKPSTAPPTKKENVSSKSQRIDLLVTEIKYAHFS